MGLWFWYLRDVRRNARVAREDRKATWQMALLLGWPVVIPVYWYRNIRPGSEDESAARAAPETSDTRTLFLRLVLGLATLWPIVYTTVLVVLEECGVVIRIEELGAEGKFFYSLGAYLMVLCTLGPLMTVFVCDVFTNRRLPTDVKRSSWVLALFLGHILVMPAYWYLYMWRRPKGVARPA